MSEGKNSRPARTGAGVSKQTLVRVNHEDKDLLKAISEREGESMAAILHKALKAYQKQQFFQDLNSAYARVRRGDDAWKTEQTEREQWSNLNDGIVQ